MTALTLVTNENGAKAKPTNSGPAIYVSPKDATQEIPAGFYVQDDTPWTLKQMVYCLQRIPKTDLNDYETMVDVSDMAEEFCFDALRSDGDNGYDAIINEAERLGVFTEDGWVHNTAKGQATLLRMYNEAQDGTTRS